MNPKSEIAPPTPEEAHALLDQIESKLRFSKRVQVIGHHRPDGDCFGSILGMHYVLEALGKEHRLTAAEQGRNGYRILPDIRLVEDEFDPNFKPDLYVFVDSATLERAYPGWSAGTASSVNIDHHASNHMYAEVNWVDPSSASTAEMIYQLARHMSVSVGESLAEAILLGLMTDTGSFRYSNVGPRQMEIAADLLRAGASVARISQAAYESRPPEAVAVTGAVLSSLKYRAGGRLVYGEVRSDLVAKVGGATNLPENLSAELRAIEGVKVGLLFVELPEGGLRLSLRGDGSVNVSRLAAQFGGGGHPNAAGLTLADGKYEESRDRIVAAAEREIEESAKRAG